MNNSKNNLPNFAEFDVLWFPWFKGDKNKFNKKLLKITFFEEPSETLRIKIVKKLARRFTALALRRVKNKVISFITATQQAERLSA